MNNRRLLLLGLVFALLSISPIRGEKIEDLHKSIHKKELARATGNLDKSVIQESFLKELQIREESDLITYETDVLLSDLLIEAKSHLGKKYRSGGKGPNAFDCSGFAGYVYKQFGYKLGASSRDQYTQGTEVSLKRLRKGDLVFFTGRNSKGGIGHVGIVVEADNEKGTFKFIHAASSGGIKIDTNEGYYKSRYVGAKRIINL